MRKTGAADRPVPAQVVMPRMGFPPKVIAQAFEDDGEARPLLITVWVGHVEMSKSLVNGGSLAEMVSKRMINKLPNIKIHQDGNQWT